MSPKVVFLWIPPTRPARAVQGRFLAIAGFGNLPGDVALYDRKPDGKFKPMGSARCGPLVCAAHMHWRSCDHPCSPPTSKLCDEPSVRSATVDACGVALSRPRARGRVENGVTLEWAPDGRHFLTATIAPRLRVDNGFHLYRRPRTVAWCPGVGSSR